MHGRTHERTHERAHERTHERKPEPTQHLMHTPMREVDFKRALGVRPCARSEHFALHHVVPGRMSLPDDLSTGDDCMQSEAVDETRRLGLIVPKRLARRAVTRNLVKRQGRAAFDHACERLACGDWLLRLRGGLDRTRFVSARSEGLQNVLRAELGSLFELAGVPPRPAGPL